MYTFCWSNSERYKLIVGPVTHMATKFGEVQSKVYKFRTGRAYDVRIQHVDSTEEEPDYDYTAGIEKVNIPEGAIFYTYDPDDILGVHGDLGGTTEFYAEGKTAKMGLFRPKFTNSFAGKEGQDSTGRRITRMYYHQLFDDSGPIEEVGIPCDEIVHWRKPKEKEGKRKLTGIGKDITREWNEVDGQWQGGIAVRDTLGCSSLEKYTVLEQQIIVGWVDGVTTEPKYIIEFDTADDTLPNKIVKRPGE